MSERAESPAEKLQTQNNREPESGKGSGRDDSQRGTAREALPTGQLVEDAWGARGLQGPHPDLSAPHSAPSK